MSNSRGSLQCMECGELQTLQLGGLKAYSRSTVQNLACSSARNTISTARSSSSDVRDVLSLGVVLASRQALEDFISTLRKDDVVMFFFFGPGCEYDGKTWLFSKDSNPARTQGLPRLPRGLASSV